MRGELGRIALANRPNDAQSGKTLAPHAPSAQEASVFAPESQLGYRRKRLGGGGWLLLLDLPVLLLGLVGAVFLSTGGDLSLLREQPGELISWPISALLVPISLALVASVGLYRPGLLRSRRRMGAAGLRAVIWSAALSVGGVFLVSQEIPDALRWLILAYHGVQAVWLVGARPLLVSAIRARQHPVEERIVILGGGPIARDVAEGLVARGRGAVRILAFLDQQPAEVRGLAPFRVAGLQDVPDIAELLRTDLVVVARPDLPREEIVRLSDALLLRGVRVKVLSNVFDRLFESIPFETVQGLHLLQVGETPLRGGWPQVKRAFDLIGALCGGFAILPFLVAIALAVKLTSPGPVFFKQTRIGRGGRPFVFYKFRSMVAGAGDGGHQRYVEQYLKGDFPASVDQNGKKLYKLVDDARVTPVGRLLRRASLDELPQLWNVIRGEMSLVGPRPCLPFEYDLYEDWQCRRLDVTPGMTGLWQVTGRSYVTFNDMVLLDLFYIGNWSMALDARLIFRTVPVILFGKGGL
jgi:exopolysaccharide biosynthesis polyprenyl glycosylphosphotransferase